MTLFIHVGCKSTVLLKCVLEIPVFSENSRNESGQPAKISHAAGTRMTRSLIRKWSTDRVRVASSLSWLVRVAHFPADAEITNLARLRRKSWHRPLNACKASITGMDCCSAASIPAGAPNKRLERAASSMIQPPTPSGRICCCAETVAKQKARGRNSAIRE